MPEIDLQMIDSEAGHRMLTRLSSEPILIDPHRIGEFCACLQDMVKDPKFTEVMRQPDGVTTDDDFWPEPGHWMTRYRPYNVTRGVLQIPITGALINHVGVTFPGFMTGYTYIRRALDRGMADAEVHTIALMVDSPGGEAAGNFELTDHIYGKRGEKRLVGFVSDLAVSGGFSIVTAASDVITTRSGLTGSVGVARMHMDLSAYMEQVGIKVTFVFAGAHKVDGNRFEPLTEDVISRWQTQVDKIYSVFVNAIARNRQIRQDAVRKTEALIYDAEDSVEIGFADRIGDVEAEMSALAQHRDDGRKDEDRHMTKTADDVKTHTQADIDAAVSKATGEALQAECTRWSDVLSSDAYAGREALAAELLKGDMAAEQIVAALKAAPAAQAPAPSTEAQGGAEETGDSHFTQAMNEDGGAGVTGNDGDEETGQKTRLAATMDKMYGTAQ